MAEVKRGRKPLAPEMIEAITYIYERHKTWSYTDIYNAFPGFYPKLKRPSRSKIGDQIKKVKQNEKSIKGSGIDELWHLGTLKDHTLSAEAIFNIGTLQEWCRHHKEPTFNREFPPITIRQALWIARLYSYMNFWRNWVAVVPV